MKKVDAIIIGFGKGGKTLAADLAKRGWKVAMIERNDGMYGGTCINIGCIPTKTLIHQASETACLTHGDKDAEKRHYREAIEKKNALTAMLRDRNYHNRIPRGRTFHLDRCRLGRTGRRRDTGTDLQTHFHQYRCAFGHSSHRRCQREPARLYQHDHHAAGKTAG